MNTTPREHGLSLVELLVGLALAAMLMAPLAALLRSGASAGAAINEQTELQVQAQFAMQRMLARVQNTPYAPLPTKLDDTTSGSWLSPALYDLRAGTNGLAVVETIAGASHVLAEPASSLSITSQPANTGQTLVVIALTLTRNNATVSLRESARLGGAQ